MALPSEYERGTQNLFLPDFENAADLRGLLDMFLCQWSFDLSPRPKNELPQSKVWRETAV